MNWEEKILSYLVDRYRKSKKDVGDNIIKRRTQVKPEKLYKNYTANNGDFDKISELNKTVEDLALKEFITFDREKFGTQLKTIYLVDEKINEIEAYLSAKYNFVSKDMKRELVLSVINYYENKSLICKKECQRIRNELNQNKIPTNYETISDILKAVAFIENNKSDLYIREVSMKVYGDSKFLEENTIDQVCRIFQSHTNYFPEEMQLEDEILTYYHVYKEPQKICIKGDVDLFMNGRCIKLNSFVSGIEFDTKTLDCIDKIQVNATKFMTVENRTSYLRYWNQDTVIFYLGGYANRFQRDFIRKVYENNKNITYYHFGDIDAGGFWIHDNLCKITDIDFKLFCMSKDELKNPIYENCLHKLTDRDLKRLQELKKMKQYSEVVEYMIENNVKLEQEIISLNLMTV